MHYLRTTMDAYPLILSANAFVSALVYADGSLGTRSPLLRENLPSALPTKV